MIQQITPTFAPRVNGLADSAVLIAQELERQFGVPTRFIVGDPSWSGLSEFKGFEVTQVGARSPQALRAQLQPIPTVLHYEGYGYARRGYPRWLKSALKCWRRQTNAPLLTLFHEVYPYHHGPPWTSSFWLAPLQRRLAGQLAQMSRGMITSKESYAELLTQIRPSVADRVVAMPIICTIGEPKTIVPLSDRPRRMMVFGHPNSRCLVYERDRDLLLQACRELEITAIDDIGVSTGIENLATSLPIPVQVHGVLSAEEIQERLQGAIAGFTSFIPPNYLAKSSVYAAFCAYGIIPIMAQGATQATDGLVAQKHYWVVGQGEALTWERGIAIAQNATVWYHRHNLAAYTRTLYERLKAEG